jgi:hypothetical protein
MTSVIASAVCRCWMFDGFDIEFLGVKDKLSMRDA